MEIYEVILYKVHLNRFLFPVIVPSFYARICGGSFFRAGKKQGDEGLVEGLWLWPSGISLCMAD